MQKALGQPIVIENIGGAGGMIAAAKAAHADPDGYTIMLHQDALAAGMTLYPDRTFDAEKDFVPDRSRQYRRDTFAGRPTCRRTISRAAGLDESARAAAPRSAIPASARSDIWPKCWSCRNLASRSRKFPIAAPVRRWSICCPARWTWARSRRWSPSPWSNRASSKPMPSSARKRFAGLPDLPTMARARLQEPQYRFLAHAARARRHAAADHR